MADGTLRRSSMLGALMTPGRYGLKDGSAGVRAELREGLSLVLVAPHRGRRADCAARLQSLVPTAPERPAIMFGADHALAWAGPDAWLLIGEADADLLARAAALVGSSAALVEQSHGREVIHLSGAKVRQTLAKGLDIDLHPRAFGPGDCALTSLSHLTVQVWCDASGAFNLAVPRASAGDIWHWLEESAREFGMEVVG